jgi:archaeosine-15-forming tRNA-guanine transglycosylase
MEVQRKCGEYTMRGYAHAAELQAVQQTVQDLRRQQQVLRHDNNRMRTAIESAECVVKVCQHKAAKLVISNERAKAAEKSLRGQLEVAKQALALATAA